MYINQTNLSFRGNKSYGNNPKSIVLHHAEASHCSVYDIHQWHLNNGWAGIGYHYFVRKDGSIWKGRPDNVVGSHVLGYNSNTLGICAEGSYMSETMPYAQKQAIVDLCKYLCNKYGISKIYGHREVGSSNCPGTNYPLNEIKNAVSKGGSVPASKPIQQTTNKKHPLINQLYAEMSKQGFNSLPTCRQGAKGNITKTIQQMLINIGYPVGSCGADGCFGQGTVNAVKAFQRDCNLSADGIVGQNTYNALFRNLK
ncbi:hypothetical protein BS638_06590 [Clostridium tepidum]|uniref:N-acetylmuramoyl-L-alanine amidase n=1 Tax=Clostridium tepidum TaxID=1962263 RepID=A0A1S9I911_9CLOT|nr:N-acetylmuramoyl-L-alanine amidase [Clostridium tepidum]OOO66789.1 hypothetical protein BS638_06590 [Clostridium tepidum]